MKTEPKLLHGDCLELFKEMPDNSVDSVVTDPPYGLSFMGKRWDYDVPSEDIWRECLRVLKPGGHLLAFAGTRTQHRMAVRIEDAGFEIRDMIAWVYASGFPKSLDVSKAIDKGTGENRQRQLKFTAWMRSTGITAEQIKEATGTSMASHYLTDKSQPAIATADLFDKLRPYLPEVPEEIERLVAERTGIEWIAYKQREVVGQKPSSLGGTVAAGERNQEIIEYHKNKIVDITAPATDAARQWQGWGTALKPALEPITVARKPFQGTVAANVLTHGTGAINIDGCRVNFIDEADRKESTQKNQHADFGTKPMTDNQVYGDYSMVQPKNYNPTGRWPANLIHGGSDEVGDLLGSAARFFYCAKTSKRDRDEGCEHLPEHQEGLQLPRGKCPKCGAWKNSGEERCKCGGAWEMTSNPPPKARNNHPTVKPTDLMRYLCRLITPPGGTVLDPFMGSGSTGKAAILEGFNFIGIEREADYVEIAKARIEFAMNEKQSQLI